MPGKRDGDGKSLGNINGLLFQAEIRNSSFNSFHQKLRVLLPENIGGIFMSSWNVNRAKLVCMHPLPIKMHARFLGNIK